MSTLISKRRSLRRTHVMLGMFLGISFVGITGMWTDRGSPGRPEQRARPLVVPLSGPGVSEEELDGPEAAAIAADLAGEAAGDAVGPASATVEECQNRVPKFLGTFMLGNEMRAIFRVEGAEKPWMGHAGERIEGTNFVLESFDSGSARIVPQRRR